MLLKAEKLIDRFSDFLGNVSALIFLLMLANVFIDVLMRYVFNDVSIAMQEMEWHLYAAMFLLGVPYTLHTGGHVRVDLVYEGLSVRRKSIIDIVGGLIFLLPFCLLVGWYGIDFAHESFALGETSGDPGGLSNRWIIKAVIPFAFFATAVSGVAMILNAIIALKDKHETHADRGLL